MTTVIRQVEARDARYPLPPQAGTDAIHSGSVYAYAVALLRTGSGLTGTGIALTLGEGNPLVCEAIRLLAPSIEGREIEDLMAGFGAVSRGLADHPQLRWLGPHKGVMHLALASLTNACFDLWAKSREVPLWRLLLDLSPDEVIRLLDLSYLEDVLTPQSARRLLEQEQPARSSRDVIMPRGYPGYDTSVGWFQYEDAEVRQRAKLALRKGFSAFKLKVGSPQGERDLRRASLLRDLAGPDVRIMLDANQQWTVPQAIEMGRSLASMNPYWIEEPTHPDDVRGHVKIADAIAPIRIALGEHVPNRILFKNFIDARAVHFVQPDCTRLAGVSEFTAVSLLARQARLPVAPHVGDMGQIHQHLVLFNHVALGHEPLFLEYIPHLAEYFVHPAVVREGVYQTPQSPGASTDLKDVK